MEIFLRGRGLWERAARTAVVPTDATQKAALQRQKEQCLSYIMTTIDESCQFAVVQMRDPKEIWTYLKDTYKTVSE